LIGLLQRVSSARVDVADRTVATIGRGLLVMVGVERDDDQSRADRLLERLLCYRVFPDADGRMNLSLEDIRGDLLLIPQFTLPADTRKGTRPSFTPAAPPEAGRALYEHLLAEARKRLPSTASGSFGADMQVTLTNDGPVTFWLET
jgi:D-tyrosyl-tRNA(Tyr) deacylase